MRIVGVIPARFASSRFPGKPLVDLRGKPMIQRVWERACLAKSLDRLLVATDDARIAAVARSFGAEAVMTPAACPSGTDRAALAVKGMKADIVVNIQGDEPLLRPAQIDQLAGLLLKNKDAALATLCHALGGQAELENPNVVKVVMDSRGRALYFSRAAIPFPRTSAEAGRRAGKHIGLYTYRGWFLKAFARLAPSPLEKLESLEQLRALENGYRIQVGWTKGQTQAVDTPLDAAKVRKLLADL